MIAFAALVFIVGVAAIAPTALASKGSVMFTDANGNPKAYWKVGDTLYVTAYDIDENRNADDVEMLDGTVSMDGTAKGNPVVEVWVGSLDRVMDRERVSLQETGNNTGLFRSQPGLKIGASNGQFSANNGTLEVMNGHTILVRYQDPTDPTDISIDTAKTDRTSGKVTLTDKAGSPINQILDVGDSVYVTVEDADKNYNPEEADTIENAVTLLNPRTSKYVMINVTETGPNTGVFRNTEGVVLFDERGPSNPGPLSLEVDDKDTIALFYRAPMSVTSGGGSDGGGADCRTSNAAISFERSVPANVRAGETFAVKVTVTAKQAVRALIVSDDVDGLSPTDSTKAGSISPLSPGQSFTFTYRVKATSAGTYRISGRVVAVTDGSQQSLSLDCNVRVSGTQSEASALFKVAKPQADTQSNEFIEVKREAPAQAAIGAPFTVKVTVTAKKKIKALIASDDVDGLKAVGTTKAGSIEALDVGQSFSFTYQAQCVTAGTFTISGKVTPVEVNVAGPAVSLSSTVVCGSGGPGPGPGPVPGPGTPGPSAGSWGDPNDPSDFALAMAKIAEANPSTVEFTDVTGKAKPEFKVGEDVFVTVKDVDANSDSDRVNTVAVGIFAPYGSGRERVMLVETGINTGVFRNPDSVKLVAARNDGGDSDGKLGTYSGGALYVEYRDLQQVGEVTQRQDEFDTTYATARVMSSLAFSVTPAGQKTVAIRFTNDSGGNIENYKVGMDVFVEVTDADANMSSDMVETVGAAVLDRDTMDEEPVTLWETGPNTGVFVNKQGLPLRRPGQPSGCNGVCQRDGNLQMEDRDFIEAHYQDMNNPADYAATIINIIPDRKPGEIPTSSKSVKFVDAAGKEVKDVDVNAKSVFVMVSDTEASGAKVTVTVTQTRGGKTQKTASVEAAKSGGNYKGEVLFGKDNFEVAAGDTLKAEYAGKSATVTVKTLGGSFEVFGFEAVGNGEITFKVLGSGIANTQVMVYDIMGRSIWSGSRSGNTVSWNKLSANNQKLANGVYIYVVIAKGSQPNDLKSSRVMKLVIKR
jgi:hypothetical protein